MGNEELFKEIDLIQGCINRMANNSFLIKGWALSVFAGATAFTQGENLSNLVLLVFTTIIPFICFWVLDAYYLKIERKYRLDKAGTAVYINRTNIINTVNTEVLR